MSQNDQTHFKNLAATAARFLKSDVHFGILRVKGRNYISYVLLLHLAV